MDDDGSDVEGQAVKKFKGERKANYKATLPELERLIDRYLINRPDCSIVMSVITKAENASKPTVSM